MTAFSTNECVPQQLSRPAALPNCHHPHLSIGLDRACCPDCRREFRPTTPEYKSAMLPLAACPLGLAPSQIATKNGSGVPSPSSTPERNPVVPVTQWVESYPTKRGAHHYYRFRWLDEPGDIRSGGHRHICGGNIHSALALARKAEIESAIALGQSPREILHLIKSWKQQ